jgi:hypothetical protein
MSEYSNTIKAAPCLPLALKKSQEVQGVPLSQGKPAPAYHRQ